jgi:integrase
MAAIYSGRRSKWEFESGTGSGRTSACFFRSECGGHLKKLQAAHDPVSAEAGVEFVMYDFWYTFATRFAETNPDPYALAAILGHSGLRCVMAYVHVQADAMKKGHGEVRCGAKSEEIEGRGMNTQRVLSEKRLTPILTKSSINIENKRVT